MWMMNQFQNEYESVCHGRMVDACRYNNDNMKCINGAAVRAETAIALVHCK